MAVASKTVRRSDWRDGFLFIGNHLALDFLNTCPVQNGEAVELLPDFDTLLRWFRAAGLLSSSKENKSSGRRGSNHNSVVDFLPLAFSLVSMGCSAIKRFSSPVAEL